MRRLVAGIVITLGLWVVTATGQQPSPAAQFVPGEVLVRFRQAATTPRRNAVLARRGGQLIRRFEHVDLHHVRLGRGVSVSAAVAAFRAEPDVLAVQPNFIREVVASAPPNDPYWLDNTLYGLQKILAQPAWNSFPAGDATIVVADLDTGVNYNHPDLAANMWHNPGEIPGNGIDDDGNGYVDDVYGIDTINGDSNPFDDHGHGTHTSGTIGAVSNNGIGVVGVAPKVKLLSCKFLAANGAGTDQAAIACFDYVVMLKSRPKQDAIGVF